jgi:hypothetical protein
VTHFEPRRMPLALLAGALFICGAIPAAADFISSTVDSPQVNTGNAGQLVTTGSGGNLAKAVTDYGVNKAYATSTDPNNFFQAISDWGINFMLSGNGLTPGTSVPLSIQYSYDANVGTTNAQGNAAFSFRIGPNALGQNQDIFRARSNTFGGGFFDECETRFPQGGDHPPGACAGSFSGTGFVTDSQTVIGQNFLEAMLTVNTGAGTADAFSTGLILGIIVPDGVTWTYSPGITGNPLNFEHATSSAVPEPSTWAFLIVAWGAMLFQRSRKSSV